jgi:hypothetical protein
MPGEKGEEECSYIFTKTNAGVCLSSFAARSTRKSTATRKSLSKFLENGVLGNLLVRLGELPKTRFRYPACTALVCKKLL